MSSKNFAKVNFRPKKFYRLKKFSSHVHNYVYTCSTHVKCAKPATSFSTAKPATLFSTAADVSCCMA